MFRDRCRCGFKTQFFGIPEAATAGGLQFWSQGLSTFGGQYVTQLRNSYSRRLEFPMALGTSQYARLFLRPLAYSGVRVWDR